MTRKSGNLLSELKRRNVFRVAVAYVLVAWVVLQIADVLFPALALPEWTIRLVAGVLILGLPIALVLAWAYELTPDGLRRDADLHVDQSNALENRRSLDKLIIVFLMLALSGFALDKFVWQSPRQSSEAVVGVNQTDDRSIAVLAFNNTSPDENQEYFADGLSEELLSALARVKQLRVIGRTSSFQFKDQAIDAKDIGQKLDVAYFLEGDVRKSGDRLRVTARLISTRDGTAVWTEVYDKKLDDVFAVQQSISHSVVNALRGELLGVIETTPLSPRQLLAYDTYLKGLQRRSMHGPENNKAAIELMEQAVQLDPKLAKAWQQLAQLYSNQTVFGVLPPDQGVKLATDAIANALAADPNLAGAYATQGSVAMNFLWDWEQAEQSYTRALEIEPNDPAALTGASMLAAAQGRFQEAQANIAQVVRVDPLNLRNLHNKAFVYYLSEDFEQADAAYRHALEFAGGDYTLGHTMLALNLLALGRPKEALTASERELNDQFRNLVKAPIYFALGEHPKAEELLQFAVDNYADRAAVPIGGSYAFMGNSDAAFEWFERAYQQNDAQITWTMVHPMNANLRDDPRFKALLEKLKLKPPSAP